MSEPVILRYAAFSDDPTGGNPAGVVLDASGLTEQQMQAIAAEVGYSETAFVFSADEAEPAAGALKIRYFSPRAEVPFCGHATIATAIAWAERHGTGSLQLTTSVGPVAVHTSGGNPMSATLVSVEPSVSQLASDDLIALMAALGWIVPDLDPELPPLIAYAGAHHPIIAIRSRQQLAELDYDFDALGALMAARTWTTVQAIYREAPDVFHSRNPFPPGGIVEDPAPGAAAAALGGYLRAIGVVSPPTEITIHQGEDLGRPSVLVVSIPSSGGIAVTGTAVPIS